MTAFIFQKQERSSAIYLSEIARNCYFSLVFIEQLPIVK